MADHDDPDAPNADDGLPDVFGEPEPGWVEEIRRGRRQRAERLKAELAGLRPPPDDDGDGEEPPA
jgi:hypothetical protein